MNTSIKRAVCIFGLFYLVNLSISSQVINLRYKQIPLSALMDSISEKTKIKVSYDVKAVPVDSLVDVNETGVHPFALLKEILKDKPLRVSFSANQIIISEILQKEETNYLRIRGKVVDESDSTAMPMVNIAVKHKALGTITNMDGDFDFIVPKSYVNDTLVFSFIGYSSPSFPLHSCDSVLFIQMKSHDVKLKEVEVRYESTEDILLGIKKNKDNNYCSQQSFLTGFFRESIKQDGKFVQVSEAIIEIQKPSYQNVYNLERVHFVKGRKLSGLQAMEAVNFKLEGGPFQFSRIDVARYFDFLPKEDGDDIYKYTYDGVDYLNEQMVFRIGFSPVNDDGELKYKGQIFVHSKSYAIVHVDFELTKRSLKNSRKALIKKSTRRIKAKPKLARYYMDYRQFNDIWILNKVAGEIVIHINDKDQSINSEFTGISELLISNCSIEKNERFKAADLFKPNYVLADEIEETDNEFWENYNIIKPDEELEKVFKTKRPEL